MGEVAGSAEHRDYRSRPAATSGTGLKIYKSGQGYYTRVGTAIGAGILIIWGALFIIDELNGLLDPKKTYYNPLMYGAAVAFILGMGGLLYWVVGLSRKTNDFFIATEGEMKKVSWSGRKEVVRSTKVVIVTVVLMGAFLFLADMLFMEFFSFIKVLKTPSMLDRLFGIAK